MKKVLSWNALLAGMILLICSLANCWSRVRIMSLTISSIIQPGEWFWKLWQVGYCWLTLLGIVLIIAAVVMLIRLRQSEETPFAGSTVLVTAGILLLTVSLMLSVTDTLQNYLYLSEHEQSYLYLKNFWFFYPGQFIAWLWLLIPAAVMLATGIGIHIVGRRKAAATVTVQKSAAEEPKEEPTIEQEERRITLYCTVMDIRGDYALVKYDDSGVESEVALALLPFGIDTGDKLKYENYEFTQA